MKKVITKIGAIIVGLFVVSLLIAKLYDIGVHRPSLAYKTLTSEALQWANGLGKLDPECAIMASQTGPFGWDNKDDVGQKQTAGKWGKEEDANAIVYYRKDKEALGQMRARDVIQEFEEVILEIPEIFGEYKYPTSLNNRKMVFYLPATDEEYELLMSKLSTGGTMSASSYGCSIIELGPLGCQNKGIVLHPKGFKECNNDGEYLYIRVIRREVAKYTFLCSLDFDNNVQHFNWFIDGVSEYFALHESLPPFPEEVVCMIEQQCMLNAEFPTKNKLSKIAGSSFFDFYSSQFGEQALQTMIVLSYSTSADSLFHKLGYDSEDLKQQWISSLRTDDAILPETTALN